MADAQHLKVAVNKVRMHSKFKCFSFCVSAGFSLCADRFKARLGPPRNGSNASTHIALDPGAGIFSRCSKAPVASEAQILNNLGCKAAALQKIELGLVIVVEIAVSESGHFGTA